VGKEDEDISKDLVPEVKAKYRFDFRENNRSEVRPKEGIEGTLHLLNGVDIQVRVYDISNNGACIVIPVDIARSLKPLDELDISIRVVKQKFRAKYSICWFDHFSEEFRRVGLKFNQTMNHERFGKKSLVGIPDDYPVVGYFYRTNSYHERCAFRLISVSPEYATIELLSDQSLLFPGIEVNLMFSLDTISSPFIVATIDKVKTVKDKTEAGLSFNKVNPKTLRSLVNHLLIHSDISLYELRNSGFKPRKVSNNFTYRFARDQNEYEKVLALRRKSYLAALKIDTKVGLGGMAAPLDHLSRIMTVYQGDNLVASLALTFPGLDNELDTERSLENGLPKGFPPRDSIMELSRLCIDPEFQKGDILIRIFEHSYRVFATSGRQVAITSTDDKLWPTYKKIGFRKTGLSYAHPTLNGLKHDIIRIDLKDVLIGRRVPLLAWLVVYSRMTEHVLSVGKLKLSIYQKIRIKILLSISKALGLTRDDEY